MIRIFLVAYLICIHGLNAGSQVTARFSIPDTVCINAPVTITNQSVGASTYFWNFCTANLSTNPVVTNLGNPGNLFNSPVFIDYALDKGNYYGFMSNYVNGNLVRLDFGNSLLNTPTATNLGNFGGIIPASIGSEGIQLVQQAGNWFAIMVGGNMALADQPRLIKIAFGPNLNNPTPVATDWGNIGNMDQPIDLHLFEDAGRWFGFTLNSENNSITRFDFTTSFSNIPVGTNLGNVGSLSYPTGIFITNDNGFWRAFIVNAGDNTRLNNTSPASLTRLDFGNSLLNAPTGINLGNPGGLLQHPRDLTIMKSCEQVIAFAVNGHLNNSDIVRFDFNNDLSSTPAASLAGNLGNGNFPHCISRLFRDKADVYGFVSNVATGTLTRFRFPGCNNSSLPTSDRHTPPPISYDAPGTYNINLMVDEGLPTQQMECKKVVVLPDYESEITYEQTACDPLQVKFFNANGAIPAPSWIFGDGGTDKTSLRPVHTYPALGNYTVKFAVENNRCTDTVVKTIALTLVKDNIVITPDTTICMGATKQLRSVQGQDVCWFPATGLDNPNIHNPVTSTTTAIKYYCTSLILGPNLVTNGDFNAGNTGFTSAYIYKQPPNTNPGEYFIGTSGQAWNAAMPNCTNTTGNMMLVNGATAPNVTLWEQTVTVKPNTNYVFTIWIQPFVNSDWPRPQITINNEEVLNLLNVGSSCTWMRFKTTWSSGNSTTAQLRIVNKSTLLNGNDFALDDIKFEEITIRRDSVQISVEDPVVTVRPDTTLCNLASVTLPATGASTWSWSPATGLSDPRISNPVATPGVTTEYEVTGTTVNGCVAKDKVLITVIPKLSVDVTNDTTVCSNAPVPLRALTAGSATWRWYPGESLNNPASDRPVASPLTPTKYYVELTDINNCITRDSVMVDFLPKPVFRASGPIEACFDAEVKMQASGGDDYQWAPAGNFSDATSATPTAAFQSPVAYSVYISERTCNFDTLVQFNPIRIYPLPLVNATKESDIDCVVRSVKLKATGGYNYKWTPGAALDNPNSPNPVAAVDTTTRFIVTATTLYGCKANDTLFVNVTKTGNPVFQVPNAFTPNGDGKNDCFGIKQWGFVKLQSFEVFSRWGEKLFSTSSPNQCWDGRYKGVMQASGEFVYVIKASTFCGPVVRQGVFFLIR